MRGDREVDVHVDVDPVETPDAALCVSKTLLYHSKINEEMILAHGQTRAFLCCSMR